MCKFYCEFVCKFVCCCLCVVVCVGGCKFVFVMEGVSLFVCLCVRCLY